MNIQQGAWEPVRWLAIVMVVSLIAGCAGGFSKKSKSSAARDRQQQKESRETQKEQAEQGRAELPSEQSETKLPATSGPASFKSTALPTGSPYRRSDLSRLPTTINRADRSAMVLVPKGSYLVTDSGKISSSPFGNKGALYPIPMAAFYIDRHEITVTQFKKLFSVYDETIYTGGKPCPLCPAMAVTLAEAESYCARTGKRLPTETQWEAAGRGPRNQPYPWGKRFETDRANLSGDADGSVGPANVGSFPTGASAFGSMDMIGNVWEWVQSDAKVTTPTPVLKNALSEKFAPAKPAGVPLKPKRMGLVKGGGYRSTPKTAILSARHQVLADMRNPTFGFRCVKPHLGK